MILLDTNVLSELARPTPSAAVESWLERHEPMAALPSVVLEEMVFGRDRLPPGDGRGEKIDRLLAWIDEILGDRVVPFDKDAADACGRLRAAMGRRGLTIARADAMIAAMATSRRAVLATRNVKHFGAVPLLKLINPWTEPL